MEHLDVDLALERHQHVDHALEFVRDQRVRRVQFLRDMRAVAALRVGHQPPRADLEALVAGDREARMVPAGRDDFARLDDRQRFTDLDDVLEKPLQRGQRASCGIHGQPCEIDNLERRASHETNV